MRPSDEQVHRLMRVVQRAVPLEERPFDRIGDEVGVPGREVLALLGDWSGAGKLREISGILEGSALGYESALVAGAVEEADLPRVVEIVNGHPTVTHNYLRDHAYNLWFTLAVPVEMGLRPTLAALTRLTGVELRALPRTATFKIGVNFDLRTLENRTDAAPPPLVPQVKPSAHERRLFRALQTPLPLVERPFDALAAALGLRTGALLAFGREHLGGALRRYVGTLAHRRLGVRANAMIVWAPPEDRLDAVGRELAQRQEVSHCYARTPLDGFPYTLYSMVHGPDLESCRALAGELAEAVGVSDYRLLVSVEEYKKTRLRYFLPQLDEWWARYGYFTAT